MKLRIVEGGPFGTLRFPNGSIVVSDEGLLELEINLGYMPLDIQLAPFLVVELGRLQTKNTIAAPVLQQVVMRRYEDGLPTVLLLHTSPRYGWRASYSEELGALLESYGTPVEEFQGNGQVGLTQLDQLRRLYAPVEDDIANDDIEYQANGFEPQLEHDFDELPVYNFTDDFREEYEYEGEEAAE